MCEGRLHSRQSDRIGRGACEGPELAERPDRVDRAGVQADRINGGVFHELDERGNDVAATVWPAGPPLDESSLGPLPPKHVVVAEGGHEFVRRGLGKRPSRARRRCAVHHPPDAAVGLVAERRDVGAAFARLESRGRGIVLDNEVVPVDHPHLAVGADLGLDRCRPLVVAGDEVPGHAAREAGAARGKRERGHNVPCGLAHERRAIPVFLGIRPGRVEPVAGGGREVAVMIDLPDRHGAVARRLRREFHLRTAGDAVERGRAPAADPLVDAVGQRHVLARVAVGRRAEDEPLLTEPEAPRIVVGAAQGLEPRPVGREPEKPLRELMPLSAHLAVEARVADDPVHPAVEAPGEIARAGVGVAGAPTGEQHLP